jgi:hypothetical protein
MPLHPDLPDAARGFLFQYPTEVAAAVNEFLMAAESGTNEKETLTS